MRERGRSGSCLKPNQEIYAFPKKKALTLVNFIRIMLKAEIDEIIMDGELGPEHKEVLNFTQVLFHSLVTRLLYVCLSLFKTDNF